MPNLQPYAVEILWSYGAALSLIAAIIVLTVVKGARVRRQLHEVEQRQGRHDG